MADAEAAKKGKREYNYNNCTGCHGGKLEGIMAPSLSKNTSGGQGAFDQKWVYAKNATDKGMFETIANDIGILCNLFPFVQVIDDLNIVGKRCFQVNIVLQGLFNNKRKMRTFGTVTIMVITFILMLFKSIAEQGDRKSVV